VNLDRDRLTNADPEVVARAAILLADLAQQIPDHDRVLAIALFFRLYLDRLGLEPQEVMTIVGNLIAAAPRLDVRQVAALRDYLRDDL